MEPPPRSSIAVTAAAVSGLPETSHHRQRPRRVPLSLITRELEPGVVGIDGIVHDLPAVAASPPAVFLASPGLSKDGENHKLG